VALQGRFPANQGHHGLSAFGLFASRNNNEIAVQNPVLDHGFTAHAKDEMLSLAEQRRRNFDRFLLRKGLDRPARGDEAEQRDSAAAGRRRLLPRGDAAAAVPLPGEGTLLFEPLQVLLDGAKRRELEPLPNLALRG